jgi:hypothetical protein
MGLKIGLDAKLYFLDDTRASWGGTTQADGSKLNVAPEDLVEIDLVKDIEIPISKEKADVSTRRSKYKATKGTLRGITIEIPMIYDPEDEGCAALENAYLAANTTIPLAFLDGAADAVGSRGLWGDFEITDMKKGEKLADAQTVVYTAEPAYVAVPPEWVEVDAP